MDARKHRYGREDLDDLLRGSRRLIAARGKKAYEFDLESDDLNSEELLARVIGPSGALRAPTLKVGKTVLVGYGEEAWTEFFGG